MPACASSTCTRRAWDSSSSPRPPSRRRSPARPPRAGPSSPFSRSAGQAILSATCSGAGSSPTTDRTGGRRSRNGSCGSRSAARRSSRSGGSPASSHGRWCGGNARDRACRSPGGGRLRLRGHRARHARPGHRPSRRHVCSEGHRDHDELQADQVLRPGGQVRRGAPSLRDGPAAGRHARAGDHAPGRARGGAPRGPRARRRRRGRAPPHDLLRRARPRSGPRGRAPDGRSDALPRGPRGDWRAIPRGDLALLQPRRLRRRAARRHDLGRHPPRLRRGDGLRHVHCGAGPAAGTAQPDRARPLDAHRVVNPSKEGLMKCIIRAVVLATVAVLVWVATPAVSQPKVVRIGDLGSKVGVFEGYGKYQTMGIQMAVEELNAKGGVLGHRIEVISEDDETKPAPAVRKAEKLILQDDVKLLVGVVSSGETRAVMAATKKHKTIHWNSVSCAEFMRTTKFHKYYFSNQPDSRMQANGLAKYIIDRMGKRVYIFYTDYAMGQSDGRQFKTALERLGGEVVGVAGAPLDTKDFSPWFGAINTANPEVLFLAFAGTDSLRLMTQLHSFGMTRKYRLAGIHRFLLPQGLAAIPQPIEGLVQLQHLSPDKPGKKMQAVNAPVQKKVGGEGKNAARPRDTPRFLAAGGR